MRSSISCVETKFEATSVLRRVQRRLRQSRAGLRAGEIGAGLQQLLVEVGRLDLGEQLPRLHRGADVDVPALQVAADAGKDRRAGIGLEPARQVDGGTERLGVGQCDRDASAWPGCRSIPSAWRPGSSRARMPVDDDEDQRRCRRRPPNRPSFRRETGGALFSAACGISGARRRLWRLASCVPC